MINVGSGRFENAGSRDYFYFRLPALAFRRQRKLKSFAYDIATIGERDNAAYQRSMTAREEKNGLNVIPILLSNQPLENNRHCRIHLTKYISDSSLPAWIAAVSRSSPSCSSVR